MTKWQLQEAKARFSELIDDTLEKGPQVVTRRGIDTGGTFGDIICCLTYNALRSILCV
jgi:hypothetical protein